jgi:hypothetical protein
MKMEENNWSDTNNRIGTQEKLGIALESHSNKNSALDLDLSEDFVQS